MNTGEEEKIPMEKEKNSYEEKEEAEKRRKR